MQKTKIEWTDYNLGWLSGIIDGEGSISLLKERRPWQKAGFQYKPRLNIGNKNIELILKAQLIIGGGCIIGPNNKGVYNLDVSANKMREILPKLKLIAKRKQKIIIIEALELLSFRHRGRSSPMTREETKKFEKLVKGIRKLNGGRYNKCKKPV